MRNPVAGSAGTAWPRLGVPARLFGAIAVPIAVLAIVLSGSMWGRHRDVQQVDAMSARVVVLEQLMTLRSAVFREQLAAEIFVPSRRPPAELLDSTTFGAQLANDPEQLVRDTDTALAAIAPDDRPFGADALALARSAPSADPVVGEAISGRFDGVGNRMERAVAENLRFVRESAIELGDVHLIRTGTVLQRSMELPGEAGELVAATADLWSASSGRPELQSEVAMAFATYQDSSSTLRASITDPDSEIARAAARNLRIPAALDDATRVALSGELSDPARPPDQPVAVGVALLQGVDWLLQVDEVPNRAAREESSAAQAVVESARGAQRRDAALALAAVAVSVVAAVLFGRSIVGPVRRLTDQAERIGSGQLDLEPLDPHGPPEILRASRAMHDMVDNLVLLEQKSAALARADFDHPALQEQLPGQLGASLQLSLEALSDSIEQRETLQSRLRFAAMHDSLTGLGNRASLIAALTSPDGNPTRFAAVFIDLNDFKGINDRLGHPVGDEVLRAVATRMVNAAPARAWVTRLGGDEFVIALPDVDGVDEPLEVARRLVRAVSQPMELGGHTVEVGASAGVAVSGHGSAATGVEALLRMADLAVYSAKLDPNEDVVVYDDELDQRLTHRRQLESELALALTPAGEGLRLVFQPIVNADDFSVRGVEALLRWSLPSGPVPPDEFIPVAERSDLILEVDRWVIDRALRHMAEWASDGANPARTVSVNISGRSLLDRSFVERVSSGLARYDAVASRLQLEVTETALVSDLELAAAQLTELRALGVRVVIDDFGTGYTSVAHLRTLPVDELKIDASFVQGLQDAENRALIEMIAQLARQLDLPTVAEGVETAEQVEILREIGCDSLQGYFFSPPIEAGDILRWRPRGNAAGARPFRSATDVVELDTIGPG